MRRSLRIIAVLVLQLQETEILLPRPTPHSSNSRASSVSHTFRPAGGILIYDCCNKDFLLVADISFMDTPGIKDKPIGEPNGIVLPDIRPPGWEWNSVLMLVGSFFIFNLYTYNYYPNVWCDEVWFSEPAVNFVQNGSFTTTTWQFQPGHTFPTVNCPLYSMALTIWLKVTGTTLLSVRSFNFALMGVAGLLIWLISWRFGLIKTSSARLLMLAVLHLGYGISFGYRCSRPDILGLVCLSLLVLSFQFHRRLIREGCLFALAALTMWIGLQVSLFAWFACAMAWLLLRRIGFRELIVLSMGMLLGLISVLLLFHAKGVLAYFLPMVVGWLGKRYAHSPHLPLSARCFTVIRDSLASYVDDFTTLALTIGLFIALVLAWKRFRPASRAFLSYVLVLVFATPVLFNLVGHYAFYYSYVRFVPAILAFFAAWSDLGPNLSVSSYQRTALCLVYSAALAAAIGLGLPMRLAITFATSSIDSRSETQRLVNASLRADDVVFMDHAAFFEVKNAVETVYDKNYSSSFLRQHIQGHDFTADEKRSINVLIIRPEEANFTTNYFGGAWQRIGSPFGDMQDFSKRARVPLIGPRLVHYGAQPQTERYQLQIFRRGSPGP